MDLKSPNLEISLNLISRRGINSPHEIPVCVLPEAFQTFTSPHPDFAKQMLVVLVRHPVMASSRFSISPSRHHRSTLQSVRYS
jgi:hypothetical protein